MEPSVFGDRTRIPADGELEAALGPAIPLWGAVKAALAVEFDPVVEAWSFGGKAHGWSLRLERRDRAILYLTPLPGCCSRSRRPSIRSGVRGWRSQVEERDRARAR